ncbi:MAG: creatininase family protein [Planctomycetes bacterium]|nr:creatininase family protein [Planctomycetota bacterium]
MKYQELNARRLAGLDRDEIVVVVPIAAVEQHGPHMPTGTDHILCTAVAEAAEARCAEHVLLTPTLWLGASAHHLRFGATLSTDLSTYIETLGDVARSLLDDDFRRLFFLNGHGGNVDPMRVALREIQPEYPDALLAGGSYWAVADDLLAGVLQGQHKFVGHACEFETSMMLHLRPDLVDQAALADAGELIPDALNGLFVSRDMRQRTQDGYTGRPDLASAEKGKTLFEGIADRLVEVIGQLASEPLGSEHRDFLS